MFQTTNQQYLENAANSGPSRYSNHWMVKVGIVCAKHFFFQNIDRLKLDLMIGVTIKPLVCYSFNI